MNGNGNRLLAEFVSDGSLKIQNGFPCGKWNDKSVGILHLRPFNISNCGQIDLASTKFVETDKKLDNYLLREGDVIFNNTNSEELVGKTAYWDRDEQSVLSNHMTILRVLERDALDPQFLAFFLLESWFERHFEAICRRHVNQASVNTDRLGALELPPFEASEQKKIAHVLSTVQRAIGAQERIIQTTTELKKTLMHKLFTEGLRNEPQKQTEVGLVPESWEVKQLGEIARIERGKFSHRPRNESRFYGGAYPFVQTGDVSNCDGYVRSYTQTLNEEGLAISKMFPAGTILITIAANIGFTGILQFDSACPDSLIGVSPLKCIETVFLNYYLMTQQPQMDRLAPKGTQKNINIQFLKPWPVPLPTVEEQKGIAEAFSATDQKIRFATAKRDELQALFRTLLHNLMTAKIRVHDLNFQEK